MSRPSENSTSCSRVTAAVLAPIATKTKQEMAGYTSVDFLERINLSKIGVTMRSVDLRLQGSKVGYGMSHEDIIAPIKTTIASAGAFERLILNNFAQYQYVPDKKHLPSGGTDCFSVVASDDIKQFIVDNVHRFEPSQAVVEEPKRDPLADVFSSDEERDVVFAAIRNKLVVSLAGDEAPNARHVIAEIFRAILKDVFADHELPPLPDAACQRLLFVLSETREEKMYRKSVGHVVIKKLRLARSTFHLLPFEAARRIVQSQGLKSGEAWKAFVRTKRHVALGLPSEPARVYADKWQGMGDWLGTNRIATQRRTYWNFEAARTFVQSLNLQSVASWKKFTKDSAFPKELPTNPPMAYKDKGWKTWGDWLGTNFVALQHRDYIRFSKARAYVRCLELRSREEWKAWWAKNRPSNIPQHVALVYQNDGWKGWGDFSGTGFVANQCRTFRPFEEARAFVRPLGIKSQSEWRRYAQSGRKPDDIPANPYTGYFGRGWTHWGDFLGTRTEKRKTSRKIKEDVGPFWAKRRSEQTAEGE